MIKIFLQQKPIYKIQQRTFSFLMRKKAGKEDKLKTLIYHQWKPNTLCT